MEQAVNATTQGPEGANKGGLLRNTSGNYLDTHRCLEYLKQSADEISKLIRGHYPIPNEFGVPDGKGGVEKFRCMEPNDAARKISAALGIQRQGWNAFSQRAKDLQRQEDAALFDAAVRYQKWREVAIYEGFPDPDSFPQEVWRDIEDYYEKRFGTRDAARRGPDRAIEVIKKMRSIEETRQARARIKEAKKLLDRNKVRKPPG